MIAMLQYIHGGNLHGWLYPGGFLLYRNVICVVLHAELRPSACAAVPIIPQNQP